MSRGFGSVQRLILADLGALPAGYGVVVDSPTLRRAAHGLERAGRVSLEVRLLEGRRRLVARLAHDHLRDLTK